MACGSTEEEGFAGLMMRATVLTVVSESHRGLRDAWFLPSLPSEIDVKERFLGGEGNGAYETAAWQDGVVEKLRFGLEHARANPGEVFVFSDVDIQFFDGFRLDDLLSEFEGSGTDVLFQRESADDGICEVNTGFYVARATRGLCHLLEEAIRVSGAQEVRNDQVAINQLLIAGSVPLRWGRLGVKYYARSHGFPPSRDIVLHHATMTRSIAEKVVQLRAVRQYVEGGCLVRWMVILREAWRKMQSGELVGVIVRRLRGRVS